VHSEISFRTETRAKNTNRNYRLTVPNGELQTTRKAMGKCEMMEEIVSHGVF
jgi:hypothetical protein